MKDFESNILSLEDELKDIAEILYDKVNVVSRFEDLDKSIKILEQRNFRQLPSVLKKMKNFAMILYMSGILYNQLEISDKINKKLDKIYALLNTIIYK
ncbi:MAG: hypothetical protein WBP45_03750 [Daejeonella sp.]